MKALNQTLRDLPVKKKLGRIRNTLLGSMMVLAAAAVISLALLYQQTKLVSENWMPALANAEEMKALTTQFRMLQYGHVAASTDELMQDFEDNLAALENQISEISAAYEVSIVEDEDQAIYDEVKRLWAEYQETGEEIISMSRSGRADEASQHMLGDVKALYDTFTAQYDKLINYNNVGAQKAANMARLTFLYMLGALIVVVVLATVLATVLVKSVTASVTHPLKLVHDIIAKVAEGNLNVSLEYEAKDEFGELVANVKTFLSNINAIIQDENYLLGQMAVGNFNIYTRVEDKYVGDYAPILGAMRQINRKLGSSLANIADTARQLDQASEDVAASSQILAEGASEQATTIEEILISVGEVGKQSSEGAGQAGDASEAAEKVRAQAVRSNEQMNEMINEMHQISETSSRIESIIGAIESIASQTNLLSLNASIEAARAGEAGKGFAVVADEIGKLAQQCSESASNTRTLISASIEQVEIGNDIAQTTAKALSEMMGGIVRISDLAEAVRENCERQAKSMKEVSSAVANVSKVVENNSAAAQESSATSEELSAQAAGLNGILSGFRFRTQG